MDLAFYKRLARDGVKGANGLALSLDWNPDQERDADGKFGSGGGGHAEKAAGHEASAKEHAASGRLNEARSSYMKAAHAHLEAGNIPGAIENKGHADRMEKNFNMAQATHAMREKVATGEVRGGALKAQSGSRHPLATETHEPQFDRTVIKVPAVPGKHSEQVAVIRENGKGSGLWSMNAGHVDQGEIRVGRERSDSRTYASKERAMAAGHARLVERTR